ncbi:MAG: hypothetical protein FD143_2698 [Ignavibacteria bacterium]|nr:MAG: hypothetical protein FD143_2698 [Ignavibacteria bacterium]KAF0156057.1 MAG: hypothetical protein FD188_3042 [Ignavibacteria bacterium]
MKKVICIILISSLLITSCSRRINRDEPQTVNEFYEYVNNKCKNKTHLTIETKTGLVFVGKDIMLKPDSTRFKLVDKEETIVLSTQNIKNITYNNKLTGAVDGLLIGSLVGASYLGISYKLLEGTGSEWGYAWSILAIFVFPAILLIGTIWGLIGGSETKIEIY